MTASCAIYLRVSLDVSGDREAVQRQLAACRKLAKVRGLSVFKVYEDNSVSASKREVKRPHYEQMITDLKAGKFATVITWNFDRLTRQPRQIEDWIEMAEDHGVALITANGDADLGNVNGRLFARILANVARAEIETKTARQRAASDQRAEAGLPFRCGPMAFGYQADGMTVNEVEAEAIRQAAADVLAGASLRSAADKLTANGHQTWKMRKGVSNAWTPPSVRTVLLNPRYIGKRVHRGKVVGDGTWPAILDVDTHASLVRLLTDSSRNSGGAAGRKAVHLLSTVATCTSCHGHVNAASKNGRGIYTCRKHCATARRDETDRRAEAAAVRRLSDPAVLAELAPKGDDKAAAAQREADRLRKRLAILRDEFDAGEYDDDAESYRARKAELQAKIKATRAVLDERADLSVFGDLSLGTEAVLEQWAGLPVERKRAIIERLLVVRIRPCGKAYRWDPEQHLEITPR